MDLEQVSWDWLISINDHPISLDGELFDVLLSGEPEKTLNFRIQRKKKTFDIPLWVVHVEESEDKMGMQIVWNEKERAFSVASVLPNSRADAAGVQKGDVLLKEGSLELNSWTNFYRALSREKRGQVSTFEIARDEKILEVLV